MMKILGTADEFWEFLDYLREFGAVDMVTLESEIRDNLQGLLFDQALDDAALDALAELMLLRYCLASVVASAQDLPPLVEAGNSPVYEIMTPHRQQMARYAPHFPEKWRELLARPEAKFDGQIAGALRGLTEVRREPKARVYFPAPLFQELSELRVPRDYFAEPARSKAALWGKDNANTLMGHSARARYRVDRLVKEGRLSTGKAGQSAF